VVKGGFKRMSKEMTPREALSELCDLATPNGDCLNYVIGLSGIILKALDRLELLEKENQALKKDNIIKYEYLIEAQKKQIAKLEKENEKHKKVLNFLKELFNLKSCSIFEKVNNGYTLDFVLSWHNSCYEECVDNSKITYISEEIHDLLKEVLENV
jgi:hypothetical protein